MILNIAVQDSIQTTYNARLFDRLGAVDQSAVAYHESTWPIALQAGHRDSRAIQKLVGLLHRKDLPSWSGAKINAEIVALNLWPYGSSLRGSQPVLVKGEWIPTEVAYDVREDGLLHQMPADTMYWGDGKFQGAMVYGENIRVQGYLVKSGSVVTFDRDHDLKSFVTAEAFSLQNLQIPANVEVHFYKPGRLEKISNSVRPSDSSPRYVTMKVGPYTCSLAADNGRRSEITFYESGRLCGCLLVERSAVDVQGHKMVIDSKLFARKLGFDGSEKLSIFSLHLGNFTAFYDSGSPNEAVGPVFSFVTSHYQGGVKLRTTKGKRVTIKSDMRLVLTSEGLLMDHFKVSPSAAED